MSKSQFGSLDLVKRSEDYVIYLGDRPLLTTGGREVSHVNGRLLRHILTDLLLAAPGKPVRSFQLFEYRMDVLQDREDPLTATLSGILESDPFVRLKSGLVRSHPPGSGTFEEEGMNLALFIFPALLKEVNAFFEDLLKQEELDDRQNPFIEVVQNAYTALSPEEKSAVGYLVSEHEPGLVLPMLLLAGRISPAEYAKGMISLTGGHPKSRDFSAILWEAYAVMDYVQASKTGIRVSDELEAMIRRGEGSLLEFKSTLRWDLRQGKTSQHIERAVLKTISAFLNSDGGILLIGVRDDGSAEGIESDRLDTEDRWLLHLWTLIRTSFGKDVSPYIRTRLETLNGKTICVAECSRSLRPVFLKQPGFEEEFYIRVGPASTAMSVSEALKYIGDRFPGM